MVVVLRACSGPSGLFAALEAAEAGLPVVLLERGQAVEQRGRDIGALFVRRVLDKDSNLCYGESPQRHKVPGSVASSSPLKSLLWKACWAVCRSTCDASHLSGLSGVHVVQGC